jgi:hypothetical protein
MPKKLRCDRCGFRLSDPEDVGLALEGEYAWATAVQARGDEPRGVFPCKHYIRCGGEVIVVRGLRARWKWVFER